MLLCYVMTTSTNLHFFQDSESAALVVLRLPLNPISLHPLPNNGCPEVAIKRKGLKIFTCKNIFYKIYKNIQRLQAMMRGNK